MLLGGGKTISACARTISYLLKYPGSIGVVGAESFPLLQRTVLKEWADRFTEKTPWDHLKLPNRLILKKPTQTDKSIVFANGSRAIFQHFSDPAILRGIDASIIHYEEASLLPDKASFEELTRRLSGRSGPLRQLILTTNPDKLGNWISESFKLKRKPDKFGNLPPIVEPCNCHLCQRCLNSGTGEVEYLGINGEPCTDQGSICPACNKVKESSCPGRQDYYRVIQVASKDNPYLPEDYVSSQKRVMDKKTAAIFVEGDLTTELRESYVYRAFTEENNIYETDRDVDYTMPIMWTMDFNYDPQCSIVCQEIEEDGQFHVGCLDEIILWNSLPEHAAQEFCRRYEGFKNGLNKVFIYGDPMGLYGIGDKLVLSFYDKVRKILIENGFNVKVMMKRPPKEEKDNPLRERVKIPVADRIAAVNAMLCNAEDPPKIRLKINSRCLNLIASLRELQFTEDGKNIDHSVDKRAGRSSNKEKEHIMTHPSDALGYYIYKRFPQLKQKEGMAFIQFPGQSVIDFKQGKVKVRDKDNVSEKTKERRKEREERRKKRKEERDKKKTSIRKQLEEGGIWGYFPGQW